MSKNLPVSQNCTPEQKPFQPTNEMIKWLEAAIELGHTASVMDISDKSEVSRRSWYYWIKEADFVKWWDSQWQQHLALNRWKLDAIGMKQAERNYDYWRAMMERTGNIQPVAGNGQPPSVNINNYIAQIEKDRGIA